MSEKNWNRLILDIATNIRSLSDGVNRLLFNFRERQKYPEYLDDIGALCACIRVFQDTLSPISQHLVLHPYEKIYKDPISMPDLLTTSISDQMKEENKISENYDSDFKDLDHKQILNRVNEFNNSIISISQSISDIDVNYT